MGDAGGEELVRFVVSSRKRMRTLLHLRGGSATLHSIKKATNSSSSAIIPQLRRLERRGLVTRNGRRYSLSYAGEVIAEHLHRLTATAEVFERFPEFWSSHEISALPQEFRMRLYELGNYRVIKGDSTDPFVPHREYLKILKEADWMMGVSPVLHPDYPEAVLNLARRGKKISLILTEEVIEKIIQKYPEELNEGIRYPNTTLMVCSDASVAFTVTDSFLSMMLPLAGGHVVDMYTSIISHEASAI
ncbi:MAG: winged helix-turn-helix domain-containing protein, partial [Deferribacteres bacterium]|nr:winged helix-turn-helix domain-containing protein [Deferribacteres bacterium]